ncbi:SOS response-associated peptidase [Nakamurella aerolata]|uniref:Abasic site processing protein n=1 Tax=Nakamurella aerolata TaxID=1656892 RepID=A0A849A830_9ACTN|nr:SOS response-associated peptidase [Nakamurella aerolata]NNG36655.1 SOS response-associated peptidase [Nakamurella aerolata]
MCGRYATTVDPETLYGVFEAEPDPVSPAGSGLYGGDAPRPRYNIAPTDAVAIVRSRPHRPATDDRPAQPAGRFVAQARWGLVPSWAKDVSVGSRMFNARADSVPAKPAFKRAFERRRCLVPASGFYEWQKLDTAPATGKSRGRAGKQPFYITPKDGSVLAFAGLWEFWRSPDGAAVVSNTIITTAAVGEMAGIHDRMPLVLPASEWALWLDPAVGGEQVLPLLAPPDPELVAQLEFRPVGADVGNVANDSARLIERVSAETG